MDIPRYINFIDSYSGRDKILRLLYYSTKCISGFVSSSTLIDVLNNISNHINSSRILLRFFDDVPMMYYTLSYGLRKEECDKCMRLCGWIVNIFDQFYYPFEHIAWAADIKILRIRSDPWWAACNICWIMSLYFMIMKSLRHFHILQLTKGSLKSGDPILRLVEIKVLQVQISEVLNATRCFIDLIHAVHRLPNGFLWAGKLKKWQIGILGMLSSIIILYQS